MLIVVTLCFASDPTALLAEARRTVRGDGAVILGTVFADYPWGRFYQREAAAGHPFYAAARFLTRSQTLALVTAAGLRVQTARSALRQPPSDTPAPEPPCNGGEVPRPHQGGQQAPFCVIRLAAWRRSAEG